MTDDTKTFMIDITPQSLKTPEGAKKVADALKRLEDVRAEVANNATFFLRDLERNYDLNTILEDDDREAFADLKNQIKNMDKAQENFLRALAGRETL